MGEAAAGTGSSSRSGCRSRGSWTGGYWGESTQHWGILDSTNYVLWAEPADLGWQRFFIAVADCWRLTHSSAVTETIVVQVCNILCQTGTFPGEYVGFGVHAAGNCLMLSVVACFRLQKLDEIAGHINKFTLKSETQVAAAADSSKQGGKVSSSEQQQRPARKRRQAYAPIGPAPDASAGCG